MNIRAFFELEKVKGKSILQKRVLELQQRLQKLAIKAITKEYRGQGKLESPVKRFQRSRVKMILIGLQSDAQYMSFTHPKNTLIACRIT